VVFNPNGELLASTSNDKTIRLWSTETGVERSTLRGYRPVCGIHGHSEDFVRSVAFSPDGELHAWVFKDKTVKVCRLNENGVRRSHGHEHSSRVESVAFSGDSKLLASACDKTLQLWSTETWEKV